MAYLDDAVDIQVVLVVVEVDMDKDQLCLDLVPYLDVVRIVEGLIVHHLVVPCLWFYPEMVTPV